MAREARRLITCAGLMAMDRGNRRGSDEEQRKSHARPAERLAHDPAIQRGEAVQKR